MAGPRRDNRVRSPRRCRISRPSSELAAPRPPSGPRPRGRCRAPLARHPSETERHPVTQVNLYDTTLRDGMQGQGMSLSAAEKVRVVQALDRLGVGFVEAGFPSSNPKEAELFRLLAEVELETAQVCAFGMTRRRGLAAEEDPALRDLVGCAAPVVTFVGKTWALHLEKVTRVSREENLAMIVDSVNYARAAGQAGRLRRRALLRRLARRPGLRARVPAGRGRGRGRERDPLRHQRLQPPRPGRRGDRRGGRRARRAGGDRDPRPQRRRVRGRQLARGGRGRRADGAGDDQRLRRALRQRQPGLDPAGAAAQAAATSACPRTGCGC